MKRVLIPLIAAVSFLAAPVRGQEVFPSPDGFASLPWSSSEDQVRSVWGPPATSQLLLNSESKILFYEGLSFGPSENAALAFVIDPQRGLIVGGIGSELRDFTEFQTEYSDWVELLTSLYGEDTGGCPGCGSLPSHVYSVVKMWCRDCNREDAESYVGINGVYDTAAGVGHLLVSAQDPSLLEVSGYDPERLGMVVGAAVREFFLYPQE